MVTPLRVFFVIFISYEEIIITLLFIITNHQIKMTTLDLYPNEYNAYYQPYINKASHLTLKRGLKTNLDELLTFLGQIPDDKYDYRYKAGKWTIKEIIQHLIDTERIFAYRALRIAREDQSPMPGFDQDAYIAPSLAGRREFSDLINEYKTVRFATVALFESFDEQMLLNAGTVSGNSITVRAIGFIIMGHESHHCSIISERYL